MTVRLPVGALIRAMVALLAGAASPAMAHEVMVAQEMRPLVVLTLSYADGTPFAYEQFEVTPHGANVPSQVGRTDARGRAAVLPVAGRALDVVATSKDGHGARLTLPAAELAAAAGALAVPPAPTADTVPRAVLIAVGAGLVFGLFGLIQLFHRRKGPRK